MFSDRFGSFRIVSDRFTGRSTTTHGRNIDRTEWNTEPTEPIFGRTDLRKGVSEAKFDVEADFDVKKSLAPPKSANNHEKPKKKLRKTFRKKNLASKNRKLQIVRNAFSRSFAAIRAKFEGRTDVRRSRGRWTAEPIKYSNIRCPRGAFRELHFTGLRFEG